MRYTRKTTQLHGPFLGGFYSIKIPIFCHQWKDVNSCCSTWFKKNLSLTLSLEEKLGDEMGCKHKKTVKESNPVTVFKAIFSIYAKHLKDAKHVLNRFYLKAKAYLRSFSASKVAFLISSINSFILKESITPPEMTFNESENSLISYFHSSLIANSNAK